MARLPGQAGFMSSLRRANSLTANRRYSRGVCFAVLILGVIAGVAIRNAASDDPKVLPAPVPSVIYQDRPVIQTTIIFPNDCLEAISILKKVQPDFDSIVSSAGRETDILQQARVAIIEHDTAKLNDAGSGQNQLTNQTSQSRRNLEEAYTNLQDAVLRCDEALKK